MVEVQQLLERVHRHHLGHALYWAATFGHVNIVRLLLEDGRADPACDQSIALWDAAKYSRVRILKAIINDGRADPTAFDNEAMRVALEGRHTKVVALLERVIPRRKRWNRRCGTIHIMFQVSL